MSEPDGFKVTFKCAQCGEHCFYVRWRELGEDIATYMDQVIRPAVGFTHNTLAPWCTETKCDLKLPMPEGTKGIGMRLLQ